MKRSPQDNHASDLDGLSRAETVYAQLKAMIRNGALLPGRRMREVEIAKMQGVSRTPVREALNRLLSEGLLEQRPARGITVTSLGKQQVLELYGVREFLEGAAARFASQHASLAEMRSLERILDHGEATEDTVELARLNKLFHLSVAEAAHNAYLVRSLVVVTDALLLVPGTTYEMPSRIDEVRREHADIREAIEKRNADAAEAAARRHIRLACDARLEMMFGNRRAAEPLALEIV